MTEQILKGVLLDDHFHLTLSEFSRACTHQSEWVVELVEEGILEPQGNVPENWLFTAASLDKARKAFRLQQDLQVNMAGIALALQLMDELHYLRTQLGLET